MGNPHEYREVMKAAMRFNEERTVEQVMADQTRRHEESRAKRGKKGASPPSTPTHGVVQQSELDKMNALLGLNAPKE